MGASATPLYLPISQVSIDKLLASEGSEQIEQCLQQMHWCELPSLLALQQLPKLFDTSESLIPVEQFLNKAFLLAKKLNAKQSSNAFIAELINVLSLDDLETGITLAAENRVSFLSADEVEDCEYLDLYGDWDFQFKDRYLAELRLGRELTEGSGQYLTDEQSRIVNTVRANPDDHLHVEGYAGTGKTFQVNAVLDVLQNQGVSIDRVMILTQTYAQRMALAPKLPADVNVVTFGWLAKTLIPDDLTNGGYRHLKSRKYDAGMSDSQYAQLMNLSPLANLNPVQVAKAVRDVVRNYCYSANDEIGSEHIPGWIRLQLKGESNAGDLAYMSPTDMLLSYANIYWHQLMDDSSGQSTPRLLEMHIIKLVSLNDWCDFGRKFSHVLIDESHDLSPPMRSILEGSNLPIISFGDRFQSLREDSEAIPGIIRQQSICHSYRAGSGLNSLVNPILFSHPKKAELPFVGDVSHKTELKVYKKAEIPEKNTAIFVSTLWGLFEWVQRLTFNGMQVRVLGSSKELTRFVQDAIDLFHSGIKPRHGLLLQYNSWDKLYNANCHLQSFKSVHQMLEQGYNHSDWERAANMISNDSIAVYTLSTLSNARNSEFNTVYITPDMMDVAWNSYKHSFSKTASELYIGATRVKHRLYIPESMQQWIEDLEG